MSSPTPAVFKPEAYVLCGEHLVCAGPGICQGPPGAVSDGGLSAGSGEDSAAVPNDLVRNASEHAEAVVASAERHAAEIIAQAGREAAESAHRAAEEARAGALAALDGELAETRERAAREAEGIVAAARAEREVILATAQRELLVLALEVARRVVAQELRVSPDVVLAVAGEALARLPVDAEKAQLRVNPEDLELVEERRRELLARAAGLDELNVRADNSVSRGGCTLKSEAGEVDSRLETRVARIGAALVGTPDSPEGDDIR